MLTSLSAKTASLASIAVLITSCSNNNSTPVNNTSTDTSDSNNETTNIPHEPTLLEINIECISTTSTGLNDQTAAAINIAEQRYDELLERTQNTSLSYTDYTNSSGEWELAGPRRWTSGFLPGSLWYLYALTDNAQWRSEAEVLTQSLESIATATDNDTSFQIFSAYGIGRLVMGETWVEADDAINMEAVLDAATRTESSDLLNAAIAHADTTWNHLVRPDFSTYHVASFNAGGTLDSTRTHQGWREDSTWSRGQAWAIYGYEMLYRYTQLPRMLERAESNYQYFKQATQSQSTTWVPYADFDAEIDLRNPRDSSATAIVASAAIQLYETTGNTLYLQDANDMLNSLTNTFLSEGTPFKSLLVAASEQYVREDDDPEANIQGYEVGASFGDFYYLEALYRMKNTAKPTCL